MREIRLYGSEGGGAVCSPYPYQRFPHLDGLPLSREWRNKHNERAAVCLEHGHDSQ